MTHTNHFKWTHFTTQLIPQTQTALPEKNESDTWNDYCIRWHSTAISSYSVDAPSTAWRLEEFGRAPRVPKFRVRGEFIHLLLTSSRPYPRHPFHGNRGISILKTCPIPLGFLFAQFTYMEGDSWHSLRPSIQDIVDEVAPIQKAPLWDWGPIHSNVMSLD